MFGKNKDVTPIDRMIKNMENMIESATEGTDEYADLLKQYDMLLKTKTSNRGRNQTELKDWLPVIGSIGGILVIVTFEAFGHTLTSKSLGFASKIRA